MALTTIPESEEEEEDDTQSQNTELQRPCATHTSATYEHVTVVSQNLQGATENAPLEPNGTRANPKFEAIAYWMTSSPLAPDILLAQETWLTGTWRRELGDITILHHGPEEKDCRRGRGGLAIFMKQSAKRAWEAAGEELNQPGCIVDRTTRLMSIPLLYKEKKTQGKRRKLFRLNLINIYAPHGEMDPLIQSTFDEYLDQTLTKLNKNAHTIVGGDFNASIARRQPETPAELTALIGPHGLGRTNAKGETLITTMQHHKLRNATSFFRHNKYGTHRDMRTNTVRQLDYFLISRSLGSRCTDAKVIPAIVSTDHRAIKLTLRLGTKSTDAPRREAAPAPTKVDQSKLDGQTTNAENRKKYNDKIAELTTLKLTELKELIPEHNGMLDMYEFSEICVQAAKELFSIPNKPNKGWYVRSHQALDPLIEHRNTCMETATNEPSEDNKTALKQARKAVRTATRKAQKEYWLAISNHASNLGLKENPRKWWQTAREFEKGLQSHWKEPKVHMINNADGNIAQSQKQNLQNFAQHLDKVYNRQDIEIDWNVLDDIEQRPIDHSLAEPPTFTEYEKAVGSMSNGTAPGASQLSPEMLKSLEGINAGAAYNLLLHLWHHDGNTIDPTQWRMTILKVLYKGKGQSCDPNNYRGIALQEVLTRAMSRILTNRLLKVMKATGCQTQFGCQPGIGCIDGLFLLRAMLQNRREHNLATHVLFIDLVKAFDTAHHDLLYAILAKYGIPPPMINVIKLLYTDLKVNVRLGDSKDEAQVSYTNGVKQGDNMAPVLFLFLMQAMAEALAKAWQEKEIAIPTYYHYPVAEDGERQYGMLAGQKPDTKESELALQLFYILYVDDGAFAFENRTDATKGAAILYKHLARFGLIMHIGRQGKQSKTEAMYFPSKIDGYTLAAETEQIVVEDGYITYCDKFKYLGSIIEPNLRDHLEIRTRIRKAQGQIGGLIGFFRHPNIPLASKKLLYLQVPLNTVLWGCESWTLSAEITRELQVFHHRAMRKILNLNIYDVMEKNISNKSVRKTFGEVLNIDDIIRMRQLIWIGKLARKDGSQITRNMLASWSKNPRKVGRPQLGLKRTYINAVKQLVPTTPTNGELSTWIDIAKDRTEWNTRIKHWQKAKTTELHPFPVIQTHPRHPPRAQLQEATPTAPLQAQMTIETNQST